MMIPRFARATMSPKEMSWRTSRVASASPSAKLSLALKPAPAVVAACPWCNPSSTKPCLTWARKFQTIVSLYKTPFRNPFLTLTVCIHIPYSRADLYNVVAIKRLRTFEEIMKSVGRNPDSLGCELCKPAIASILASLYNQHVMDRETHELQDTNDRFLANIQRNGTFSVVPRVPGGEITADKLIAIGQVAKKYNLYCKITGGQRIDMFGAKKQDLLDIWTELVNAGMESGHAYAKSLRTIKVCLTLTLSLVLVIGNFC